MKQTDIQTTLQDMWRTRPARPRDDRMIAGVAAAIARRYDVDPVLIRVAFVVAAFTGIGAALYIAGWAVLPEGSGEPAPRRALWVLLVIALGIATISSFWSLAGLDVGTLVGGAVAALLLFALHRSRAQLGGLAVTAQPAAPPSAATNPLGGPAGGSPASPLQPAGVPPSWDPLGAAPFAWDLAEPATPPPPPAPPRPRVTAATLAAALLAAGLTGLVLLVTGGGATIVFGVALAVLGTGLVIGAFRHAGRGLIPIALATSAVAWLVIAAPWQRWEGQFQELRFAPATAAEVMPTYTAGAGTLELDLRRIDLTAPPTPGSPPSSVAPAVTPAVTPVVTSLRADAGDIQVFVPPTADVTVHGSVDFGHIAFAGQERGGPDSRLDVVDDLGIDGVRSGRPIVLDIQAGFGNVEVHRG